ncbi:MAG TPA: M48 family metallopeptidase [Longimicrobiales bacterium]|nr:M48 family metallopeptidase [Longimicrobiales bacterium]
MKMRMFRGVRHAAVLGLVAGSTTLAACGTISTQQEQQLGADYASQINAQLPIVDDAQLNSYINNLGRQIAAAGDRRIPYRFYIVNAEQVNAFAVPGGYVYVNRGLVEATDNMSELAGVLAHEIGHVEERHSVEQMSRVQNANLGLNLAYILLGRAPSGLEQAAIGVGGNLVFARYSRGAEDEADEVAIPLLMGAGINPRGLLTFFDELLEQQRRSPSSVETWFSTHPTTQDRIANTRARIDRIPASQLSRLQTNSSAYNTFKARMARYQRPPAEYRVSGR